MADLEGNVRAPKKAGGRTKIHNNCEGLSEEVIERKKLRTPPGSTESAHARENRMQEIRRQQALRWYKYKPIIKRWEVLFALKNPWSDVTALKSGWTKDKRGPPPKNAHPSTLKTPKDFPEVVEARRIAAEKREATKARKLAAAQDAGPSAAPKGKKKTSKRAKKVVVQSPPAASSKDDRNDESQHDADDESAEAVSKVSKKKHKKPAVKGISIREPEENPPRATIDTTNLVTDAPLATAPPSKSRAKPSAKEKGKKAAGAEDEETLAVRQDRIAKERRAKEKLLQEQQIEEALLRAFEATPEEKRAEFARKNNITHLVAAKYDTQRRLKEVEVREKTAAAASAALDKLPEKPKEKPTAPKQKPVDVKATKAAERKAKEALKKGKSQATPAPQPVPAAPVEEDVASSNEAASPLRGEWDAAEFCRILSKMANAPQDIGSDEFVPAEILVEVSDQMLEWEEYLQQYDKAIQIETFYLEAKGQDVADEESQKFFDGKIAQAVKQQRVAQENAMCINAAVRQIVTDVCLKHNDDLEAKRSRKRKATSKEAADTSAPEQVSKKKVKKNSTKPVDAASARQETPPQQPTPPRVSTPPPAAATEQTARVEQEVVMQDVPQQVAQQDDRTRDFSPAVTVQNEDADVDIVTRSRETGPILRLEGPSEAEEQGSKSASSSSSGSSCSSEGETSEGKEGPEEVARQVLADLDAMEEDEEVHNSHPPEDVAMTDREAVATPNDPADQQTEVVARQAEGTPREEAPEEDLYLDILQIPRPAPKITTIAGPSNLNANNDMPVDELLNSRHPREMLPLFQGDVPRGGPKFIQRQHKPSFFGLDRPSPYLSPRTSASLRFWTQEQAIYYTQVLMNKDKIIEHSYLDMPTFYSVLSFQNVAQIIDELHAHRLFALPNGFNPELIKQFYSTLFVSGHPNRTETWLFDYMIQGQVFHLTIDQFLEIINLPRFEGLPVKIHDLPQPTPAEFSAVMNPDVIGDGYPPEPMPKHLVFEAKTWFYILAKTLIPLQNVHDDFPIPSIVQNAILKLVHGIPFDFEDFFIRNLVSCADSPSALKPYAPWLMAVCNYSRAEPFLATRHPKLFSPPVRPVLAISSRPNDPFAEYVGSRQDVNERNIQKKFIKPVNHMEVSLRTQQMLQHFIEEDRVQKQFMMNEINRVRNIAYNNNQIGRECLRREWKGLRKFYTPGLLERAGFVQYPEHLDRPWAQLDRPDRPDPHVPRLPENRDICSVDRYYNIAIAEEFTFGEPPVPAAPAWSQGRPRHRSPADRSHTSGDAVSCPRQQARRPRSTSPEVSRAESSRRRRSHRE